MEKRLEITNSLIIIIIGAIISIIFGWYFEGLGFWMVGGLSALFAGVGNLVYILIANKLGREENYLRAGLIVLLIGVGSFISFAPQLMLGSFQIASVAVMIAGAVIAGVGVFKMR
ncbi:MAG: hypothetical protein ACTSSJ_07275 [Candidatus Odinarchaeia archaeon]